MSRCEIFVQRADGKVHAVYCHSGSDIEENGIDLLKYYNTQERAEALVAPGDLSIIAAECTKPEGHSFDTPVDGYCIYYGRDRHDDAAEGEIFDSTEEVLSGIAGETYLWMNGKWWWPDHNRGNQPLIPLTRALGID